MLQLLRECIKAFISIRIWKVWERQMAETVFTQITEGLLHQWWLVISLPLRTPSSQTLLNPPSSRYRLHSEALKPLSESSKQTRHISSCRTNRTQIGEGLWGSLFARMLTMCICVKKATALADRPSDTMDLFQVHSSHWIPLLELRGLPLQIPLSVYTAAAQYGLV